MTWKQGYLMSELNAGDWVEVKYWHRPKKEKTEDPETSALKAQVVQTQVGSISKEMIGLLRTWDAISETDLQTVKEKFWKMCPEYSGKKLTAVWHSGMHCLLSPEGEVSSILHVSAITCKVYKMTGKWNELLSKKGVWLSG